MTGKPGRCGALAAVVPTLQREKVELKHRNQGARGIEEREGRRAQEDKTPGALSAFATKNLWFVTTAGIPSHKPAERAAACASSSTKRHLSERREAEKNKHKENVKKLKQWQQESLCLQVSRWTHQGWIREGAHLTEPRCWDQIGEADWGCGPLAGSGLRVWG